MIAEQFIGTRVTGCCGWVMRGNEPIGALGKWAAWWLHWIPRGWSTAADPGGHPWLWVRSLGGQLETSPECHLGRSAWVFWVESEMIPLSSKTAMRGQDSTRSWRRGQKYSLRRYPSAEADFLFLPNIWLYSIFCFLICFCVCRIC